jgi:transcriptional regulator with GAF, ATPase, and Fis domain
MASLTWSTPEKDKKRYIFYKKATSIGTSVDNDIVMPKGVDCQPHHARVIFDGRDFSVVAVDKGASVVHKKKRKSKCHLKDGDTVTVGDVEMRFNVLDTDVAVQQVRKEEPSHGGMVTTDDQAELKGLRRLCDFSRVLMSKTELPQLLDSLVDMAVEVAGADKGFLIMMDGDRPRVQAARNIQRKAIEDPVEQLSDSVIQRVVKTRAPLIVSDALKDTNFRNAESVLHLKLCSLMAVPLLDEGKLLGLLYVGNDRVISLFDDRHLEIFTIFAAQASMILAKALLLDKFKTEYEEIVGTVSGKAYGQMVGNCDAMQEIYRKIGRVATVDVPVLVTGETGTGKELVAREIHERSNRKSGAFIAINCGAIPENLMESEMFGHVRGAFTGAVGAKPGKFHAAHGGTIFLDEIGELPVNLQVKLLRVLQDKQVLRVGSTKPDKVDSRVLAATNRDLEEEMKVGRFREDLFYRLNVVTIHLPPLKERGDDIVLIAKYIFHKLRSEIGGTATGFSPGALKAISMYPWPGNVRQLENKIKKAMVMCEGTRIGADDLELGVDEIEPILPLTVAKEEFQKRYILDALRRNAGNRTKTAEELGVDPRTIFRYLEKEPDAQ